MTDHRIQRIKSGLEASTLGEALAAAARGDRIVYHKGLTGSAPRAVKDAALALSDAGLCLLTQRYTGERNGDDRVVEYLMIKAGGRKNGG